MFGMLTDIGVGLPLKRLGFGKRGTEDEDEDTDLDNPNNLPFAFLRCMMRLGVVRETAQSRHRSSHDCGDAPRGHHMQASLVKSQRDPNIPTSALPTKCTSFATIEKTGVELRVMK